MATSGFPDLTLFWMGIYGGFGYDWGGLCGAYQGLAAGIPQSGNPPFTPNTLLAMYPKFFGMPAPVAATLDATSNEVPIGDATGVNFGQLVTGSAIPAGTVVTAISSAPLGFTATTTLGSSQLTAVSSTAGLLQGQPVTGPGLPAGTEIESVGSGVVNLTQQATATASGVAVVATASTLTLSASPASSGAATLAVYTAPPLPLAVVQVYINLATASLASSRWRSTWPLAMCLFVAHFLTLWLESEGNPQTTVGQMVANSLEQGLLVSQSADGLSAGVQMFDKLSSWGTWTKTTYGTQLATFARVAGAGPIYVR